MWICGKYVVSFCTTIILQNIVEATSFFICHRPSIYHRPLQVYPEVTKGTLHHSACRQAGSLLNNYTATTSPQHNSFIAGYLPPSPPGEGIGVHDIRISNWGEVGNDKIRTFFSLCSYQQENKQ